MIKPKDSHIGETLKWIKTLGEVGLEAVALAWEKTSKHCDGNDTIENKRGVWVLLLPHIALEQCLLNICADSGILKSLITKQLCAHENK